jgi:hypothetical protein
MRRNQVLIAGVIFALALSGCSKETKVVVNVILKGEEIGEAASGVKFSLLPYDIESIRDSLRTANAPPDEPTREDQLALRGSYEKINDEYNDHLEEYREAESEIKQRKDLTSNTYKTAYKRYTDAKAKNKSLNEKREAARTEYINARKVYDQEVESWEGEAYKGLQDVISMIRTERGITEDYLIKTDKEGVGRVVVPGGNWWIYGKERHPTKKYTWLIWNVPIQAAGGVLERTLSQNDAIEWTE